MKPHRADLPLQSDVPIALDMTKGNRAEELIRALFEGTASVTGPEFLTTAVKALADALQINTVGVSIPLVNRPGWNRTLAGVSGGQPLQPTDFRIIRSSDRPETAGEVLVVPKDYTLDIPGTSVVESMGLVWLAMTGLVGSDGAVIGHIGLGHTVATDLTQAERQSLNIFGARIAGELERLDNDAELKRLSDLRERIVAEGPFGVMYLNLVDGTRLTNDRAVEIFGRTFVDGRPTPWSDIIHPDDLGEFRQRYELLHERGDPLMMSLRILRPNGEVRWLRMHGAAVFDDEGRPCENIKFFVDRTEEHKAQVALEAQNAELRGSLDAFPDMRFHIDASGTVLGVRAGDDALLYSPITDIVGGNIADRYPPHIARRVLAAISMTLEGRRTPAIRLALGDPDDLAHYEARFAALGEDEVIMVVRDAADLHLLEDQLVHAGAMHSVGRLAGGIAHDFNNVLHVIRGHAAALERNPHDAEATERRIGAITRAVDRSSSLIDRLMRISQPVTHRSSPTLVDEFLGSLTLGLDRMLNDDIELLVEFDAAGCAVVVDDSQLENVILNLVANASDAMPFGGTITIATSWTADDTVIEVSDTGEGMNAVTQALVFEPFFTTKSPELGTGLGLATSYSTVTEAGGSMAVRSALGSGTTFTIRLPTVSYEAANTPSMAEQTRTANDSMILVVEDDPDVLELCEEALRNAGYQVVGANGGNQALALLDSGCHVDLMLTDVMMPKTAGPELAAQVLERVPGLPVIFMSGYAAEVHAQRLGWAAEQILRKPFSDEELLRAVERLLR